MVTNFSNLYIKLKIEEYVLQFMSNKITALHQT